MTIEGKWALITGASRGVGLRVAKSLGEKGCRIILHSRNIENTKDLLNELRSKGIDAHSVEAELSREDQVVKLIEDVNRITNCKLDILYNNAAIMTEYVDTFTPTFEDYSISFMVNTIVPAKLCDAFIPGMLKRNFGRIVNVTSGIENLPQLMPYSCSKAALDRYVRDLVPTLKGTNVLLNLLDPGWLSTDLGGPEAPNSPDSVIPGAIVPVILEENDGSGKLYQAQDYT